MTTRAPFREGDSVVCEDTFILVVLHITFCLGKRGDMKPNPIDID